MSGEDSKRVITPIPNEPGWVWITDLHNIPIHESWAHFPIEEILMRLDMLRRSRTGEYPYNDRYEDSAEVTGYIYQKPGTIPWDDDLEINRMPVLEAEEVTQDHRKNITIEDIFPVATRQQKKILRYMLKGMQTPEIASRLGIKESTVRVQISRLKAKKPA